MDDILEPMIKAFLGQMDSAMKVSATLSDHDGSEEITVDHLITGLVYRLMVPMTNEEVDVALESAQQIIDTLEESDEEKEEDEEEEEGESEESYDTLEECYPDESLVFNRKVKTNQCNCSVCAKARVCLLTYENHDCSDPLAEKFKKAIDNTCDKHKIYI
jgi:hypothetical protein